MVLGPLADPVDVAEVWRPLSDAESAQAEELILKVSARLRQRMPQVDSRMALFTSDPANPLALNPILVADVVATVIKRFMVNIDGVASTTDTVGPASFAKTFVNRYDKSGSDTRGSLAVTDADLEPLRPYRAKNRAAGSIRISAGLAPRKFGREQGFDDEASFVRRAR